MSKQNHYVNNADFLAALIKFHEDCDIAKKENKEEEDVQPCCVCLGAWDIQYPLISFGCKHEMCSRCVNTFFKTPTRPACHMCRQAVCHISVPAEALNEELFQDTRIRIIRETA